MLVAISGSQGTGKTTLLNELHKRGYNTIKRKTSRSILTDWGVTLNEVNNDLDLTVEFQNEIIKRKFDDELVALTSSDVWFTERTYADFFVYALISLGKDNNYSEWLDKYFGDCLAKNTYYHHTFYLRAGHFKVESDGIRGSNQHYSRMVDLTMMDVTQQMFLSRLSLIDTPNLEERVSIIQQQLNSTQLNSI